MTTREMLAAALLRARMLQAALHEVKTEAATLRIDNGRLRDAGLRLLLWLLDEQTCCRACGNKLEHGGRGGHTTLCPARPLADVLSERKLQFWTID